MRVDTAPTTMKSHPVSLWRDVGDVRKVSVVSEEQKSKPLRARKHSKVTSSSNVTHFERNGDLDRALYYEIVGTIRSLGGRTEDFLRAF